VLNAVVNGRLPLIERRLTYEESMAIKSGDIYVWEDRERKTRTTGNGRWMDGIDWKRGRIRKVSVDKYIILCIIIQLRFQGIMYHEQKYEPNDSEFYITSDRLVRLCTRFAMPNTTDANGLVVLKFTSKKIFGSSR
jgi:hypothetical protein